jgi:hypothetical protein
MITTERVKTADVYPDPSNPRVKMTGIQEMADSFALNAGEPFTPPLLRRDGGIYYIVDGERRWNALKAAKTTEFTATVCDSLDEANAMLAMLATDDKQPLSNLERSRGVQQMLTLGIDPDMAAKAARIDAQKVYKVIKAQAIVDDAAEDMTLDRLCWIGEHEDYTAEELAKVRDAEERQWESVARGVEHEHNDTALVSAHIAKLEAQRLTALDGGRGYSPEIPESYHAINWTSEPICEKCILVVSKAYWMDEPHETICCTVEHERPVVEDPEAAEREERKRAREEEEERWTWERKRRQDWLDQTLKDTPAALNSLMEWSVKEAIITVLADDFYGAGDLDGDELRNETFFEACARFGFGTIDAFRDYRTDNDNRIPYIDLLDHMAACGYELSEQEQERLQNERETLEHQNENEEKDDE